MTYPPQPPYPPQQPPYGYTPYGYPGYPPPNHPRATLILVLGILSVSFCSFAGPFAWVLGRQVLAEIDRSGTPVGGRGQVQAGYICGIVGTVLLVVTAVIIGVAIVIGVANSGGAG